MSTDTPFSEHAPSWFLPPEDTPEFMYPAWASCLRWAVCSEAVQKDFESATGIKYHGAGSPIEAMLDAATGHNPAEEYIKSFLPWFNEWVWGSMDGGVNEER